MLLDNVEEFMQVSKDLLSVDFSAILGNTNSCYSGLKLTGADVEPLINQGAFVEIGAIKFVAGRGG